MKGIACILVLTGHYLGIYKYAQSFCPSIHLIDAINKSPLSFLIDEGCWLHLFFVISGYLATKTKIHDLAELCSKIIKRFLRLAFPIFFSCTIIFLIYKFIGFHHKETSHLFQSIWFQHQYYSAGFTFKDVLLSPIKILIMGDDSLNRPYWVLAMMFFSSVLIYLINYFFYNIKSSSKIKIQYGLELAVIILCSFVFPILSAHMIGMLLSDCQEHYNQYKKFYSSGIILIILSILFLPEKIIESFIFAILIFLVPRLAWLDKFMSLKIFQSSGNISWGVYSFHWPLIYSVGALCIINFYSNYGLITAFIIGFVTVIFTTILLSVFFYFTFDKISSIFTNIIYRLCLKKFERLKK